MSTQKVFTFTDRVVQTSMNMGMFFNQTCIIPRTRTRADSDVVVDQVRPFASRQLSQLLQDPKDVIQSSLRGKETLASCSRQYSIRYGFLMLTHTTAVHAQTYWTSPDALYLLSSQYCSFDKKPLANPPRRHVAEQGNARAEITTTTYE